MVIEFKQTEIGKIPEDWEIKKICQAACINNATVNKSYEYNNIEYIDVSSVDKGRINGVQHIPTREAPSRAKRIVRDSDILISTVRPNLKHFAFIKKAKPNTVASTGFAVISAEKIIPEFLYYYLTTDRYTRFLTAIADTHTSTYPAFNPDVLEKSFVPYPDESEQKAIAKILSDLDSKIELNIEMNKTLEAIGQALFKRWFIDFEFPNAEGKPYRSSGGEMVESEMGKIPKGCGVGKFCNIVTNIKKALKLGNHLSDRRYVPIDSLPMKHIGMIENKHYVEAKSSLIAFEKDDILFGAMRAYFHRVNFASFKGVTRTTTFVLRPNKKHYLSYGLFLLNQDSSVDYANLHSKGSTMPYAVWDNSLAEMPVLIPDEVTLKAYHDLIYPLLQRIAEISDENKKLSNIRDSLLPRLMSGRIRVI